MFQKFISSFFIFLLLPLLLSASQPFYVGELGQQWEFGSDHLPVGATINGHHFVSWNILDKRFLHWIEANEQGLKESAIMRDHVPLRTGTSLTLREELIVRQILVMANHPTHPRSIIALQETNTDVYKELKNRLPSNYASISHQNGTQDDVLFYDKTHFEFVNCQSGFYTPGGKNTWMILTLHDAQHGDPYTIIHSHIPGGNKSEEARAILAQQVAAHFNASHTTVILGDQNRAPHSFYINLNLLFSIRNNPFRIVNIPYPTHINTRKEASWIDNIFIAGPAAWRVSNDAQEFFKELEIPLNIFQKYKWGI